MVNKKCKICKKKFNALGNDICCSFKCSKRNREKYNKEHIEYHKQKTRESYKRNPEKYRLRSKMYSKKYPEKRKKWRNDNKQKIKITNKRYKKDNPLINIKSALKINYGITLEDYNNLLKQQNNKCAICKKD